MQKITIRNFGPITDITDLEIKDLMVFIGPQATGKSTVAKLVYFFKSFTNIIFETIIKNKKIDDINLFTTIIKQRIETTFKTLFGKTTSGIYSNKSELLYTFRDNEILKVRFNKNLIIHYTEHFEEALKIIFSNYIDACQRKKLMLSDEEYQDLTNLDIFFNMPIEEFLTKFSYNNENYFSRFINENRGFLLTLNQKQLSSLTKSTYSLVKDYGKNTYTVDLYYSVLNMFQLLKENENLLVENKYVMDLLIILQRIINAKIDFSLDELEGLVINDKKRLNIKYASAGQREIIGVFILLIADILNDAKNHLFIEEPEVHLYPNSQKDFIAALVISLNYTKGSQLLLTTHSPYILTAINNLMFAYKTAEINEGAAEEVAKIIAKEKWLNPENVGVYYMGGEGNEGRIKSIINPNTGLIGVNELDDASDYIGDEFDAIMKIKRTFKSVPQ